MNWPEVRVSRDGERLVCVSVPCGFPFARFEDAPDGPELWLGPGWATPEWLGPESAELGVWRMSKRARQRVLRGEAPTFRRTPSEPEGFMKDPSVLRRRGRFDRPRDMTIHLEPLPALIVCPRCDRTQLVPADAFPASERRATVPPTEPGIRSG